MATVTAVLVLATSLAVSPASAQSHSEEGALPYSDVGRGHFAAQAIADLHEMGVFDATGCGDGLFCPDQPLARATMAVWMVRVLDGVDPAPVESTVFSDLEAGHPWAAHIQRFYDLGVTRGFSDGTYRPDSVVSRGQMAAFLARAFDLPATESRGFSDTAGHTHEADIDRLAAAGITFGCGDGTGFCPERATTRAQIALFIHRAASRPHPDLTVAVESSAPLAVRGAFDVTITFSAPVTDFELGDIGVLNGAATSLAGSGAVYTATIEPAADGTVVVRIPESRARGPRAVPNLSSAPFVRTQAQSTETAQLGIDTWDRPAVLRGYRQEFEREEPDWGYTGDVDQCVAGTTSQDFRDSVLRRVNWYRRMAGLAAVTEDPALSATAQQKALIMLAQGALSHTPPPDWACYTEIDFPGENIGLGSAGVRGVDGYMRDSGDNNRAVGHRQQILSPLVVRIGTGNVRDGDRRFGAANTMHLDYDFNLAPAAREVRGFVAWPPPGYVPAPTAWGRWSFSRQRVETEVNRVGNTTYTRWFLSGPDFSSASVAVSDDHGPVPTEIIHRDGALVWAVNGDTRSAPWPEPAHDHCYTVTISGVRVSGTVQAPYEYAVCVLGPEQ